MTSRLPSAYPRHTVLSSGSGSDTNAVMSRLGWKMLVGYARSKKTGGACSCVEVCPKPYEYMVLPTAKSSRDGFNAMIGCSLPGQR